jgi:S1-C subfamily serine protease
MRMTMTTNGKYYMVEGYLKMNREDINKIARVYGGIPVLGVLKGSPADKMGIVYGDILLSVNGKKTPDMQTFLDAKELDPKQMRVILLRSGKEIEIAIERDPPGEIDRLALLSELAAKRLIPEEDNEFSNKKYQSS